MSAQATLDCLLIADDLTGACDAAAPFAAGGRRTVVLLERLVRLEREAEARDAQVIAVNTETRGAHPSGIAPAMAAAAARAAAGSVGVLFKKIDSTLRGNTAIEIRAAMDAFRCRAAVVCPAFPAMRRVVRDGYLTIAGAVDFEPLHIGTHLSCRHTAAGQITAAFARGERMVSVDAACDADLDRLAAEILALDEHSPDGPILWTGSAGLAAALARTMRPLNQPAVADTGQPKHAGPVVFCIGSNHAVTVEQESALRAWGEIAARAIIHIPRESAGSVNAEVIRQRVAGCAPAAVMLTGGDTAALVCRALGVHSIELCAELIPGIPLGILRGGKFDGVAVVTKSGGFGNRDALIQIAEYFSCPKR